MFKASTSPVRSNLGTLGKISDKWTTIKVVLLGVVIRGHLNVATLGALRENRASLLRLPVVVSREVRRGIFERFG